MNHNFLYVLEIVVHIYEGEFFVKVGHNYRMHNFEMSLHHKFVMDTLSFLSNFIN